MSERNFLPRTLLGRTFTATALGAVLGAPLGALADKGSTYEGTVVHISTDDLKVKGTEGGTFSFLIVPRFHNLLHADRKTTAQMNEIKAGDRVKVRYDQSALGARHADEIIDESAPLKPLRS